MDFVSSIPYSKTRNWERWVLNVIVLFPHHRWSCDGSTDITMAAGVDTTYRVDQWRSYRGGAGGGNCPPLALENGKFGNLPSGGK